jgi:hypothetical protein
VQERPFLKNPKQEFGKTPRWWGVLPRSRKLSFASLQMKSRLLI